MSTGCKGYVYKGWIVRYAWDPRRGTWVYEVKDPLRPEGAAVIFDSRHRANAWIDRQGERYGLKEVKHGVAID